MPNNMECLFNHTWEGLIGSNCPVCGSKGSAVTEHPSIGHRVYTQFLDAETHASLMSNKRRLERDSEKILDGRIRIEERGPKEYRPQMPDHLKKFSR